MAQAPITHGITITEQAGSRPALQTISTQNIGVVVTSTDADATAFPLDTPVLIDDISAALGKAGDTGTMGNVLQAINDQVATPVVLVRVAAGETDAETNAAVIGATVNGKKTGMQALLAAQSQLTIRPRILGAPGLDTQAVTAALAVIAQKLRGFAYAAAIGDEITDAVTYRGQFSQRELMLIWPDFLATNPLGVAAPSYGTARALGLRALIDQTQGWHKTLSNVAVQGVTGLTKDVSFDIQSGDTDAGILNSGGITALINDDGYRFWGNRTCSDDANFAFESFTRTAQVLMDTIATGLKQYSDQPLTPSLAKDIIELINGLLSILKRQGRLIGGSAWFDQNANPKDQLFAGKLAIKYDYTPVPPLENLGLTQSITDTYFADFASQITTA